MKSTLIKLTASTLTVGASVIGFAQVANSANASAVAETRDAREAASAAGEAREALSANQAERAVRATERAVAAMPYSAEYRHLLGQAYLVAGRFESAETSFEDALAIEPDLVRTAFNLALVQIALGRADEARAELRDLEGRIGASDLGLAMALAGDRETAIVLLRDAARANGGDPRARQNLALTYALEGRWAEARITAAQDVSPAVLDQRMADWARFVRPSNSWDQVSSLLGVAPVAGDPGQPQRLALSISPADNVRTAAVETEPMVAFTAPVDEMQAAQASSSITRVAVPAPVEPAAVPPARAYAETETVVTRDAPVRVTRAEPVAPPAAAPVRAMRTAQAAPAALPQAGNGRFVVQIGAFAQQANVNIAWDRAVSRYAALADYSPSRATFERGQTLYRLSFGGFETRGEANSMCAALRQRGVDCFVRTRAGDSPLQIAARGGAGLAEIA